MAEATALRDELLELFRAPDTALSDRAFDRLARRVFSHNVKAVHAYGAYCRARDRTPDSVGHWTEIPAVPTAAFKELTLRDRSVETERVFRTSGTSRGQERRGEHHVADLALYRASLRAAFRAFLLPDDPALHMVSLMPPAGALPDSSLAFMIDDVMRTFGDGGVTYADLDGLDFDGLARATEGAVDDGAPVLLLGTSAAFIHWLDRLEETGRRFRLPAGSRLMDTGGYKGRGRRWDAAELRAAYQRHLGLPAWACVNEYGMTELLSQYYDDGLRRHLEGTPLPARKRGPTWLRSVAVDPETLVPLPPGQTGLLRHVDLANLFSVAAIQTEDLGRVDEHGLVLDGRAAGAPPRGCSIAMDALLREAP